MKGTTRKKRDSKNIKYMKSTSHKAIRFIINELDFIIDIIYICTSFEKKCTPGLSLALRNKIET